MGGRIVPRAYNGGRTGSPSANAAFTSMRSEPRREMSGIGAAVAQSVANHTSRSGMYRLE